MEEIINKFLTISSGSGNDNGYGDDDGYGCGNGSGYGNDFGDGYGYGFGSGFDDGNGSCYDDGYGIKKYEEHFVYFIDGIQTLIYSVHGNYAKGAIINSDLTLSSCFIAKESDCFAHGETLQEAVEAAHAKTIQKLPVKERIDKFIQEYPNKNKKHSGREFFEWHHILTGSCEMGRKQFCKDNNIGIDAEYTPMEFLNICKDAYGGDVIKQIIKQYNKS